MSIFKKPLFKPPQGEKKVHAYRTSIEEQIRPKVSALQALINNQAAASHLLLLATFFALIWASIDSISPYYQSIIDYKIGLKFGHHSFSMSIQTIVNDFLLTIFFFLVGLEIKKEFLVGELNEPKKAITVIFAAFGGIVLPASLFFILNSDSRGVIGWATPIATDTALALGIMKSLGRFIPSGALTFTAALAIVDDIAAICIIALCYTPSVNMDALFWGFGLVILLISMNAIGLRRSTPYITVGVLLWTCCEIAGVHGSIAGIIIAFCIPARPDEGPRHVRKKLSLLLEKLQNKTQDPTHILEDEQQHTILESIERTAQKATTPLQRWENTLKWPVLILVLPLFSFTNAGIDISPHSIIASLDSPITLGIILGLFIGKPLGIFCSVCFVRYFNIGDIPDDCRLQHIATIALFSGIGFTMALFIATQGFESMPKELLSAKIGIVVGSAISALLGLAWLSVQRRRTTSRQIGSQSSLR